ncbi:MAG: Anaerobic dimethyl sulfoxide reductase chain B, iron-sulfur binding subunit, partial [uncultured Acetobacteraceae bacterium]
DFAPRPPRRREEARPRHRPRYLRGLPSLRNQLQGVERLRPQRAVAGLQALLGGRGGRVVQPRPLLRGGRGRAGAHGALPALLPALRNAGLRHRLPHRRLLQAGRGRHRAGQRRDLHRLRPLRLGLPLRRAGDGRGLGRDEEMHALHRPHLQRNHPRSAAPAGLRHHLPHAGAALRRFGRPGQRGFATRGAARRPGFDARVGLRAGEQVPAAAGTLLRAHGGEAGGGRADADGHPQPAAAMDGPGPVAL